MLGGVHEQTVRGDPGLAQACLYLKSKHIIITLLPLGAGNYFSYAVKLIVTPFMLRPGCFNLNLSDTHQLAGIKQ